MTIIRFLLPSNDHTLKKLLLIFWEIVPKTSTDGKLLQEMILVCDAYRKVCVRAYVRTCVHVCAWCSVCCHSVYVCTCTCVVVLPTT